MTPEEATQRRRLLEAAFQMPSVQTMVSRKSSITNAFVNSLIPVLRPTPDEIAEALSILGMDASDVRCAYCGDKSTEWDHLRPLVLKMRPTGYISEIANLVPSCGKCNQSKGNKDWRTWIVSVRGRHTPATRKIADLTGRIARLETYEQWRAPTRIDFESRVPVDDWKQYWDMWSDINDELRRCQDLAETIRQRIASQLLEEKQRSNGDV